MFDWLKKSFGLGKEAGFSDERCDEHYEAKQAAMERVLGPMDELVYHAIIPFELGGAVDMYYFSSCIDGSVCATMELINPDGKGPRPNKLGTYEVVACTKQKDTPTPGEPFEEKKKRIEEDRLTPFERINSRLCGIMTAVGRYSSMATLQPGETAEIPLGEDDDLACVIFDSFDPKGIPFEIEGKRHGLLLCMEIHRSELNFARENTGRVLIDRLKQAGVYPYSDMDRDAIL